MPSNIVRTVLGDVDPETLGHIQPHEHLLVDLSLPVTGRVSATERARHSERLQREKMIMLVADFTYVLLACLRG